MLSLIDKLKNFVEDVIHQFGTLQFRWKGPLATETYEIELLDRDRIELALRTASKNELPQPQEPTAVDALSSVRYLQVLWTQQTVLTQIKLLNKLRAVVNSCLGHIVNPRKDQESTASLSPLLPLHDIVEIVAFNQNDQSGLRPVSSVLTRKDGSSFTITHTADLNTRPDKFPEGSMIRYDLSNTLNSFEAAFGDYLVQNSEYVKKIQDSLYFREAGDRRIEVKEAHIQTFNWIFAEQSNSSPNDFRTWLRNGNGCFWLNGKAGSGKSTLMKFIWQDERLVQLLNIWAGRRKVIVLSFFFWHAGKPLQKSQEGLLRSLLYQIFQQRPDLMPLLLPSLSTYLFRKGQEGLIEISLPEMLQALSLLKQCLPEDIAIFLMIDGIDEYSGNHYDFSMLMEQISRVNWIKLLVSSRPIPACHQVFSHCPSIRLQDLTRGDMFAYVEAELIQNDLFMDMLHMEGSEFAHDMSETLVEKSSGVFMWLVLVVRSLLIGLGNGDQTEKLVAKIDELPTDLEALYDHMFSGMGQAYQREGAVLLQHTKRAREIQEVPLTALQLLAATQYPQKLKVFRDSSARQEKLEQAQVNVMERRLRSRCCGLLELEHHSEGNNSGEPEVQFLHRTVYDYLCDTKISQRVSDLCNLTSNQVDLALLDSCRYMLERQEPRRRFINPTSLKDISLIFVHCLIYSQTINITNDNRYAEILEEADTIFMQYCRKVPYQIASSIYASAYFNLMKQVPQTWVSGDPSIQSKSLEVDSTTFSTCIGLLDYFCYRIKKQAQTRMHNDLVLLRLIAWLEGSRTQAAPELPYSFLIKFVIENNFIEHLQGIEPGATSKMFQIFSGLLQKRPKITSERSPWKFWLQKYINTPESVEITLAFVHAGTLQDPSMLCEDYIFFEQNRVALELQRYQKTCTDLKTLKSINEILKAFSDALVKVQDTGRFSIMETLYDPKAEHRYSSSSATAYSKDFDNDID